MRYVKLSCISSILVIYNDASHLTYSLLEPLAVARGVLLIRFVRPSVRKVSGNCLWSFFWNLARCYGGHVVCMTELDFFKVMLLLPTWGKYAKPRIFDCIGKFSYYFFLNLVYNESLY